MTIHIYCRFLYRPVSSTAAAKAAVTPDSKALSDDYYYYDNYEDTPVQGQSG